MLIAAIVSGGSFVILMLLFLFEVRSEFSDDVQPTAGKRPPRIPNRGRQASGPEGGMASRGVRWRDPCSDSANMTGGVIDAIERRIEKAKRAEDPAAAEFWLCVLRNVVADHVRSLYKAGPPVVEMRSASLAEAALSTRLSKGSPARPVTARRRRVKRARP